MMAVATHSRERHSTVQQLFESSVSTLEDVSSARLLALVSLGIDYVHRADVVCHVLRSRLAQTTDVSSEAVRATWYLADALMKALPFVYIPLLSPRLVDLCVLHMPWQDVAKHAQLLTSADPSSLNSTSQLHWCEALIQSWKSLIPDNAWLALNKHIIVCKTSAVLNPTKRNRLRRLFIDEEDPESRAPATTQQRDALTDVVVALTAHVEDAKTRFAKQTLVRQMQEEQQQQNIGAPVNSGAPVTSTHDQQQASATAADAVRSRDEEEDDEYAPDFIAGGQVREKPAEAIIKKGPRKRVRQGDEDE